MKLQPNLERLIYALVVILSLLLLLLVASMPADYLNARVVYQGF